MKFTTIKNLSETRRLPRRGKIRLGVRVKKKNADSRCKHDASEKCNYCTFPRETEFLVCPEEVRKVVGNKPTEIEVMLPRDDQEGCFPQRLECYSPSRGLICQGNGEVAWRVKGDSSELEQVNCPCDRLTNKKCAQRGHLMVLIPQVSMAGVYQIDTGSYNSIIDLNSSMDQIRSTAKMFGVHSIRMMRLRLIRSPIETRHDGKRQKHYTLRLDFPNDKPLSEQMREYLEQFRVMPDFQVQAPEPAPSVFDDDEADDLAGEVADMEQGAPGPTEEGPASELADELADLIMAATTAKLWNAAGKRLSESKEALHEDDYAKLVTIINDQKATLRGATAKG